MQLHRDVELAAAGLDTEIRRADAVVIAASESNFAIPEGIAHVLERDLGGGHRFFEGKPVAVISTSRGMLGGVRMQQALKEMLGQAGARVLPGPHVCIAAVHRKFSADGACVDAATRSELTDQMAAFLSWIQKA